ncbi:uncharacterized protein RCO7_03506 [Rhynchosporium graminicola]|uniref:Uncharacterized protein n=1 Tax=Rhynchosporium graminicola TaxID=2792576 RepID=A0A1E1LEA4_9HELO|nr:uncharacterized protein RCO7_03506 [Rhynchosporium commune]
MSSLVKSSERLLISTKKAKGSNKELHMSKPADDAESTLHISSASASAPVPDPSTSHSLSQVIVPDADDIFSHEANESDENSTNNNYSLNITVRVAENNDSIHYHGEEGIKSNGGASREACERNNTMPGSITWVGNSRFQQKYDEFKERCIYLLEQAFLPYVTRALAL